jgi:hypothetical protein
MGVSIINFVLKKVYYFPGGATITPTYGTVSGSSCVITKTLPSEAVSLELEVNIIMIFL